MGYITLFSYDIYGDNIAADPGGTSYSSTYDEDGRTTSDGFVWVDPTNPNDTLNLQEKTTYDANGNPTEVVAPIGATTQSRYDADGSLIAATDSLGNWTNYIYDTSGRQIETLYPDGTVEQTVYDALGRPIYTTDRFNPSTGELPDGTHLIYDAAGRMIASELLSQVLIQVTTTAAGNSSSEFVSAGSVIGQTSTVYDAAGRVVESTDATGLVTQYVYDLDGRPLMETVGIHADHVVHLRRRWPADARD